MTSTTTWTGETVGSNGFLAPLFRAIHVLKHARSMRRTHIMLADLDDFILDDIGVDPSGLRRARPGMADWVVQTNSGTARLVFIGR